MRSGFERLTGMATQPMSEDRAAGEAASSSRREFQRESRNTHSMGEVRMRRIEQLIVCLAVLFFCAPAFAQAAFQFTSPGVRAPDDPSVEGIRFSLFHGRNTNMSGFDLGLASLSESENRSGLALIMGISKTTGKSSGLNSGLIVLHTGEATGVNAGFINHIQTLSSGANIGFINITDGYSSVDISGMGISESSTVQLGFINITKKIESFQLGFINIAENGFFPVFPFFNFPKSSP
jgi:hypothetical protein